jgi:hypothetical protein
VSHLPGYPLRSMCCGAPPCGPTMSQHSTDYPVGHCLLCGNWTAFMRPDSNAFRPPPLGWIEWAYLALGAGAVGVLVWGLVRRLL